MFSKPGAEGYRRCAGNYVSLLGTGLGLFTQYYLVRKQKKRTDYLVDSFTLIETFISVEHFSSLRWNLVVGNWAAGDRRNPA